MKITILGSGFAALTQRVQHLAATMQGISADGRTVHTDAGILPSAFLNTGIYASTTEG